MAALMSRNGCMLARRILLNQGVRAASGGGTPFDSMKGKQVSDNISMPDTLGHSVGLERWELLAKLAGNEDPFEMNVKKRAKGTADEPTTVPSLFDKRLVGCICEEDATCIQWMYLHQGEPKRCECGYWFKLQNYEPVDYTEQ